MGQMNQYEGRNNSAWYHHYQWAKEKEAQRRRNTRDRFAFTLVAIVSATCVVLSVFGNW